MNKGEGTEDNCIYVLKEPKQKGERFRDRNNFRFTRNCLENAKDRATWLVTSPCAGGNVRHD